MVAIVDVYFSDHDITGPEMADLIAGNPVAGIVSYRVARYFEVRRALAKLGRDPLQAKLDAGEARRQLQSSASWNGTRVAVIRR